MAPPLALGEGVGSSFLSPRGTNHSRCVTAALPRRSCTNLPTCANRYREKRTIVYLVGWDGVMSRVLKRWFVDAARDTRHPAFSHGTGGKIESNLGGDSRYEISGTVSNQGYKLTCAIRTWTQTPVIVSQLTKQLSHLSN